ncbi:MAG: hypothetical protein WC998_02970 [Candidatus Paceibacterota bacterium]|jgi:hypothetical protein
MSDKKESCFAVVYYSSRLFNELFVSNLELLDAVGGKKNVDRRKFDIKVTCPNIEAYHSLINTKEPIESKFNKEAVEKSLIVKRPAHVYRLLPDPTRKQLRKQGVRISFVETDQGSRAILTFPDLDTRLNFMDTIGCPNPYILPQIA